jgi:hypothetical protein
VATSHLDLPRELGVKVGDTIREEVAVPDKPELLVLGAGRDGCFTVKEVHATARAYGTEAEVFPDMGHNMMLEPGWASVAERIHSWMTSQKI